MATSGGFEKWERPRRQWYLELLQNLRSGLSLRDTLIGLGVTLVIALLLIGLHYQSVPTYEVGQIATRDFRAFQDLLYEDVPATEFKRDEAESAVPAVYQLETDLVDSKLSSLTSAFADAREELTATIFPQDDLGRVFARDQLLRKLNARLGGVFPDATLDVLLHHNFNSTLESRMLSKLDKVLRNGIISDRGELRKEMRFGIVIREMRDGAPMVERPMTDAWQVPDLSAARELLRQTPLIIPGTTTKERGILDQFLESQLIPTLIYNREETLARRQTAAARVPPVEVPIKQGQLIVRADEPVTEKMLQQLNALRNLHEPRSLLWQACGYFIVALILVYSLWRYFFYYQTRERRLRSRTVLILCVLGFELLVLRIGTILADILNDRFHNIQDPFVLYYGIPLAFGALLIALLVDVNLALMLSLIVAIFTGLFFSSANIATFGVVGCIAGIYSIRQYKDRAAILKSGITISVANLLTFTALALLLQRQVDVTDILFYLLLSLINGILASTLASMLLPALEAIFQATTDVRLLELSNLNSPILRRLAVDAPGTYHHSLMLATLAEAAAESIGANPLLARVGAYYHDIGKMAKPEYFVENQGHGSNRHEDLSPSMSCLVIASHIKDGLHFAKMAGLPPRISDLIPQHHGTRLIVFFYNKAVAAAGGDKSKVVEADFRYPGPKPQSREAAILMMADALEAASRTMGEAPAPAQIVGMIDRVVDAIVSDGQFDECDITMRDIRRVKDSFFKIIAGSFHHRIEYPGYDFKGKKENGERDSGAELSTDSPD